MTVRHLLKLPVELIAGVLGSLEYKDLLKCSEVCFIQLCVQRKNIAQLLIDRFVKPSGTSCTPPASNTPSTLDYIECSLSITLERLFHFTHVVNYYGSAKVIGGTLDGDRNIHSIYSLWDLFMN